MSTHDDVSPEDFRATAREAVAACAGRDVAATARQLASSGLLGVLASESVGGLGLPLAYAAPIAAEAGAGLLGFPLIENMLLARALEDAQPSIARRLVTGDAVATIAWRGEALSKRDAGALRLDGAVDRAVASDHAQFVLMRLDDGSPVLVPTGTQGIGITPTLSFSLEAPDTTITLDRVAVADPVTISTDWYGLWRGSLILRAATMLGASEAALAQTIAHVSARKQFGSALVANQAVRHMLARHKLVIEGMRSAIERVFLEPEPGLRRAGAAFLFAAETSVKVTEGAIQLHGGMGFTWDVPLHRHLREVRTQAALGDVERVRAHMAGDLIDHANSDVERMFPA